ncbi:MAG: Bug family tripartite tricarboxylate transporter substrate binding protein [Roseobacter sp.]
MKLHRILVAGTFAVLAAAPLSAQSVSFDEPIRFVTPYPPGGSHSLHAGIITTAAEPHFGQSLISVIRSGGGGAVGATEVANAPADGLTLLFGDSTINSLRPQVEDLPYGVDDFVPVARINYSPAIFVARADAPFATLEEMVSYATDNPGDLVYSSDNLNGWTYTVFELLKARTGVDMTGVEYGGGGPAIARLLGGETMAYAGDISVVGEHIESGALVPLCVTDTVRIDALPDVAACPELGYDVVFQFWRGVLAPAGTPPEVVAALSDGFEALMADEGFLRLIGRIGSSIQFADHEAFGTLLSQEIAAMADVAALTGTGD